MDDTKDLDGEFQHELRTADYYGNEEVSVIRTITINKSHTNFNIKGMEQHPRL